MSDEPEPKECPICLSPMEATVTHYRKLSEDETPKVFSFRWECSGYHHGRNGKEHHDVSIERTFE